MLAPPSGSSVMIGSSVLPPLPCAPPFLLVLPFARLLGENSSTEVRLRVLCEIQLGKAPPRTHRLPAVCLRGMRERVLGDMQLDGAPPHTHLLPAVCLQGVRARVLAERQLGKALPRDLQPLASRSGEGSPTPEPRQGVGLPAAPLDPPRALPGGLRRQERMEGTNSGFSFRSLRFFKSHHRRTLELVL